MAQVNENVGCRRRCGGWPSTRHRRRFAACHVASVRRLWTGTRLRSFHRLGQRYELTLAKDFVDHLDTLPEGETGRVLFQVDGKDGASKPMAAEISKALQGKTVLGLVAQVGEVGARPEGPAMTCHVRLNGSEASVQVSSSDAGPELGSVRASSRFR